MNPITILDHTCSPRQRAAFNALMLETFGFSFEAWHRRGLWGADYIIYAIFDGEVMLSSVGVYQMDLLVNGKPQRAYQIGAVATHPDHRGQGFSRQILSHILDERPGAPFFLFANPSVLDFYPRFGFRRIHDQQPCLQSGLERLNTLPGSMRRLSVGDPAVGDYLSRRACFSNLVDCVNAAPVQWFHLLLEFPENLYEIPALQVMFAAGQEGSTLTLYNVWAKQPITFAGLAPYLAFPGVCEVRFGFNPDWLGVDYRLTDYEDNLFFARGDFHFPPAALFPMLLRT